MSGSQIGGVAGAIAGSFIPGVGTQLGYAIGSAIGGYVDPVKVKGPQLTDAAQQTSSVGIPLPFGYGTFSTAGNVIWADELKEHVKRQRQGKGGGTKTTTYTYTRSYAIGVCEGPIYGYLAIKRNGKTVYNSDPNAPVEDKDYSAKWLQKATLYYGGEDQMPDSTIEAVEGAGNVSAFRGLAYIVVENDDLTDMAGAVPQYEFIVQATMPDVYVTSHPYPVSQVDSVYIQPTPIAAKLTKQVVPYSYADDVDVSAEPISGALRWLIKDYGYDDSIEVSAQPIDGVMRSVIVQYRYDDDVDISAVPQSGKLRRTVISYRRYSDEVAVSATPIEGKLSENI